MVNLFSGRFPFNIFTFAVGLNFMISTKIMNKPWKQVTVKKVKLAYVLTLKFLKKTVVKMIREFPLLSKVTAVTRHQFHCQIGYC
jgi:ABC-type siderophore export system fused ATPase/permease subunit